MIEDNKIKTNISPFVVRKGEIKTFDGKDGYVSMNQIINKMNIGQITDLHFSILSLVNEFEFITSRQIMQMLETKGIDIKSQDKLNHKLDMLVKLKIITRYYFSSNIGKSIYRVYCLEKNGKYLLDSRDDIKCTWQLSNNTKSVPTIKKRLAGNQVIIAYLKKVKTFTKYEINKTLKAKISGKTFKVNGGIVQLSKGEKSINFIFEVVRREDDWEKLLIEKISLYKEFYDNFIMMDSGFKEIPQLIIVCEDDKHMAEVFRIIISKKLDINRINLYYTTDLKQTKESLSNSLTEFKLDEENNKYKAQNIELKLLL